MLSQAHETLKKKLNINNNVINLKESSHLCRQVPKVNVDAFIKVIAVHDFINKLKF